jgi:hypothetical protein
MALHFDHPAWALTAGALAAFALLLMFILRTQSPRWRTAGILLPLLAAASTALALANTSISSTPAIAIVLDFSPSARTAPWHDPDWVRTLAQKHLRPGQPLTLLADDGIQRRTLLEQTTPAATWPALFDWNHAVPATHTDAAEWLITDALFPAPQNPPAAATIIPPAQLDVGIADLLARSAGTPQSIEILVKLRAVAAPQRGPIKATATLTLQRDGKAIATAQPEFSADQPPLDASRWITFRETLSPDDAKLPHHYTARVSLQPSPDPWPENDSAETIWPGISDQPKILTLSNHLSQSPAILRPAEFFKTASELTAEGWQAVILDDIPAVGEGALSSAAAQALDHFVRDTGGGLLITARTSAFGPGHYGEGEGAPDILEALSPVASRPEHSGTSTIFLLDASASMNEPSGGTRKFTLLARAVEDTNMYISPNDNVAIILFNSQASLLARGTRSAQTDLDKKLQAVSPSGATAPDTALPLLRQTLADFPNPRVIFLTDGEIPSINISQWKSALAQTPFTIIAPRDTHGGPLMQLASSGINAQWRQANDPAAWKTLLPEIILETERGRLREETLHWHAEALTGAARSWIQTWTRRESQVIAQGDHNEPAAALVQRGLGTVGALMIDVRSNDEASVKLRSALLERVLAPPGDRRFHAQTQREGDVWRVEADGIDAGSHFLNAESLVLHVLGERELTLNMRQAAPGHYEALVNVPGSFVGIITRDHQLVAKVIGKDLQTAEYPASVESPWNAAKTPILAPNIPEIWQPRTWLSLAPALWLTAVLLALTALWLRA